jgi:hypothetical protein
MFLANIGEQHIESIYEVRPGDNFGWSQREGPLPSRPATPPVAPFPYLLMTANTATPTP